MERKQCLYCGSEFEGRKNKLFCSENCRINAFRNGKTGEKTDFSTDNSLNNGLEKRITDDSNGSEKRITVSRNKSVETLIPVTVMLTSGEKESLEQQARDCGVDLSIFIRYRANMNESDTTRLETIIQNQKAELEELKVKLSFYNKNKNSPEAKHDQSRSTGDGSGIYIEAGHSLVIKMSEAQKKFLLEKYLDTNDYNSESPFKLSNGTGTRNAKKWYEDIENVMPGSLESGMVDDMIECFFKELEERFVDICGIDADEFEFDSLYDLFKLGN
jgi:hypothetical protein